MGWKFAFLPLFMTCVPVFCIVLSLISPAFAKPSSAALEDDSCLLQTKTSLHASSHGAPEVAYPQFISGKAKPIALRSGEVAVQDASQSPASALMQTVFDKSKADQHVHSEAAMPEAANWDIKLPDEGGGAWGRWAGAVDLESSNGQTESASSTGWNPIKAVGRMISGAASAVKRACGFGGPTPGGSPRANKAVYDRARRNVAAQRRMGWDPDPMPDPDPKPCIRGNCGGPKKGILSRAASAVGSAVRGVGHAIGSVVSGVTGAIGSLFNR